MNHMSEEELITYRDGETAGRDAFGTHLKECADCRREMERIEAVFAALDTMPVPDPGDDYGTRVWQRIAPRLPEKRAPWWHGLFQLRQLALAGAMSRIRRLASTGNGSASA